ncbi:non-ribosomal peptide synthase protein (TIGR01720 family)/amino acid adenylation domain-containing protein [Tumebacillus sp. BK434]|uniref:non-ribosomal peptide synthetase n=1 Tax=Tumebacillus sp. BK434 TaxID=2512169 RepID=UPI0010513C6D|nr:non-ribosomal peptide synthetase [Tumebacillus sp. BK434]TCP55915.1 non-ribosomal peptide synthase protein (TIGR01720 family)/amino acid adenylation domain-containing protein [Tumebacillus sp. BK434]
MATEKLDLKKELTRYLLAKVKQKDLAPDVAIEYIKELQSMPEREANETIAIVGVGCKFPDADDPDQFWDNLASGRNSIRSFPSARADDCRRIGEDPSVYMHAGFLERVDQFDPEYFNIPPRVAVKMDPYHRLLLQVLIETIEDAGYHRGQIKGRNIGIYIGNDHTHRLVNSYLSFLSEADFTVLTGSWTGVLASRLSYLLNLRGPAMVIDTACSSSLVALDSAVKAIWQGDCESALVGGANLLLTPGNFGVDDIQSDDFVVRAFDYRAEGTVWGEGVAAVYLKPLSKALADRDHIYGVIRGMAMNNDGTSNGLTAPNARAQQEVLAKAWERAGIPPETISYLETHGTGTKLGDPIEIKGLTSAFAKHTAKRQFCAIGSIKTNIGHTVGAAGMASLIKVLLALREEKLPPSLNFDQPNPLIDFSNSPVYLQAELTDWAAGEAPRRAGISSFSLSGTNAHVVVEEAPREARSAAEHGWNLLPLSGRTPELLLKSAMRYLQHLRRNDHLRADDISFTACTGREHEPVRAAILGRDATELCSALEALIAALAQRGQADDALSGLVRQEASFSLFVTTAPSGGGAQIDAAAAQGIELCAQPEARANRKLWEALADAFVQGAYLDFAPLFAGREVRRVSLPTRVFDNRRFWDETPRQVAVRARGGEAEQEPARQADMLWAQAQTAATRLGESAGTADPVEHFVAWVWSEVLGYSQIQPHDDFYGLGGDSVTGLRIIQGISVTFGVELPISVLMGTPVFSGFVQRLKTEFGVDEQAIAAAQASSSATGSDRAEPATPFPLSPAQNRIFLTSHLQPESLGYNVTSAKRMQGQVDLAEVNAIFRQLIARHDSLRTSFHLEAGTPVQRVQAEVEFAVEHRVLAGDPTQSREQQVQAELAEFVRPFDLSQAPLIRARLMQFADGESYLALDIHHIVTDGSSMGVLFHDYMTLAAGGRPQPLRMSYREAVEWLCSRQEEARFEKQRDWWRQEFADGVPMLELPADRPRPTAMREAEGERIFHTLPGEMTQQLKSLAKTSGATLFMVLMAAFHQLLARLGNERDVVIGTPVAGRSRMELQPLVGMFVNTLPVRTRSQESDTFLHLVQNVKATVLGAYEHQDYPYEKMIEDVQPERIPGRNPLFDVYFAMQNIDMGLGGTEETEIRFESGSAKFDMTVTVRETPDGLLIEWEYATALFKGSRMQRMVQQYQRLLTAILANPQHTLAELELELIAEEERRLLLHEWNDTATNYPGPKGIVSLFEEIVERQPEAAALIMDGQQLSYQELNARSNRIARSIVENGVQPGTAVALLLERSFDMIASLLGVLKAGCYYLPLDASLPAARIQAMIADGCAPLLVTHRGLEASVLDGETAGVKVLRLEAVDADLPAHNLGLEACGEDLAYILYTSGSTGMPKGTLIRQKSVIRVVRDAGYLTITSEDVFLQISNYSFDGATFDIYGALLNGARLVLLHKEEVGNPQAMRALIHGQGVTVFFITTSLFNVLIDASPDCFDNMRAVLIGGEALSFHHVQKAFARLGPNRLINGYGPTETTVFAVCHVIQEVREGEGLPIGRAIGNTTLYVLDDQMRLQPIGVPGELYIGGEGLAVGYLNRPELTAERFVDHPFQPGERLYRTGDLVSWDEAGYLHYLGRLDQQVKLRGFRIELLEVDAAARKVPGVREVCAGVHVSDSGAGTLCLWVEPFDMEAFDGETLRQALALVLPEYMVPSFVLPVADMPLNKNGKIDRSKLPAPSMMQRESGTLPRDEREAMLVGIWEQVLGVTPGIEDNFFALGGDSIKAIQVAAKVQAAGLGLEMAMLFQHPTVAALAPHLQAARATEAEQGVVSGPCAPTVIQKAFAEQVHPPGHYTQAMLIQGVTGLEAGKLAAALTRLCQHHDALRMSVNEDGSLRLRGLEEGDLFHLSELPAGAAETEQRDAFLTAQRRLQLERGPLIAAVMSADAGMLMLAIHHIAVDVVSWNTLLEDLVSLLADAEQPLPFKTTSLPAWTSLLHEWAEQGGAVTELPYWRETAIAAQAEQTPLSLQTYRYAETAEVTCTIGGATGDALGGEANRAFHTETVHLVLSVLTRALCNWTDTSALLLNLEGHGREEFAHGLDVSRTVGWFTSNYPVLFQTGADAGETVKSLKETLRSVPRRGFGYGVLKALTPGLSEEDQALLASMRPAVNFNYLGLQGAQQQDGVTVEALSADLTVDGDCAFPWALDIVGSQTGAGITFAIRYATSQFASAQMNELLTKITEAADELVQFCLARPNGEKTASDFTVSPLRQEELESILDDLDL